MRTINNRAIKDYTRFFRSLSDPTRLGIVLLLAKGELCVCQIEATLKVHQAKISRHLAYLRKHKIAQVRREWKWKFYSLTPPKNRFEEIIFKCLNEWLQKEKPFRSNFSQMQKCLAQPLEVVAKMTRKF